MIQILKCKKCSNQIKIDYSKAPKDEFVVGCPTCNQKYKLNKPQPEKEIKVTSAVKKVSTNIKNIPCPKCKSILGVDFSKLIKYPAIISCKNCSTKLKINDPNIKSTVSQNNLDKLKTGVPQVQIDTSKIDPKNNWAYNLYYYTRRITYLNKVTLFIYLVYLSKSISKTLNDTNIAKIDLESFAKLKAESIVISSNVFNSIINPILTENGISPRLMSWATNWFVKKVSIRIVLSILDRKGVDRSLPYVKKYIDDIEKDNQKIVVVFTNQYSILLYFLVLIILPLSFDDFRFRFWPAIFATLFFAGLSLLLANYKDYLKTKNVLIGNLVFWLLVIILPRYPETSYLTYARETFDSIVPYYLYFFTTLCLAALIFDYLQSKGKNFDISNKIKILFRPAFSALIILIPFLCLTVFSSLTKHKVSDDELKVFNKKNTEFIGYWYFLSEDSTKVNNIYIGSNVTVLSNQSGDIDLLLEFYFDDENTIKLNKYYSSLKLKEDYNFEIKYPITFDNVFQIISYENNVLNGILTTSSGEKLAITAKRDSEGFEEAIRLKKERIEQSMNGI